MINDILNLWKDTPDNKKISLVLFIIILTGGYLFYEQKKENTILQQTIIKEIVKCDSSKTLLTTETKQVLNEVINRQLKSIHDFDSLRNQTLIQQNIIYSEKIKINKLKDEINN